MESRESGFPYGCFPLFLIAFTGNREDRVENGDRKDWIKPVGKSSLSKIVMDSVRNGIIGGEVAPGDFLPSESELASRFGVGKSSVREAMKMLEAQGYIEVCKGNGYKVRTAVDPEIINPFVFQLVLQSSKSRDDLLEFRGAIERAASLLALEKATGEDIRAIRENIDATVSHAAEGKSTLDDDIAFHHLIYQSTHNPYLVIIGKAIMELFRESLRKSNTQHQDFVISDHEAIYRAIAGNDRSAVIAAVDSSLESWYRLSLS